MTGFYPYLIKSVFALAVLYILYWALFRKETFFRFNRAYFLFTICLIGVLPSINLGFIDLMRTGSPVRVINSGYQYIQNVILTVPVQGEIPAGSELNWADLLRSVYWTGVFLLCIRLVLQSGYIISLILRSDVQIIGGLKIVANDRFTVPFSFFSYLFLPHLMLGENNLDTIIAHEKEHIKQRHWIDLLMIEFVSIVQWFNPFVWLFRWSLKETHEFLADQGAMRQGISKPAYLGLLMEYVLGTPGLGLIHSFNYSLNKKRIKMMKKDKSPNHRKLRIFVLLPAILVLSMAFSSSVHEMNSTLFGNLNIQDSGIKVKGMIVAEDTGKPLSGAHIIIKGTSRGVTSDENGEFEIEVDNKNNQLVISYVGYETITILPGKGNYDEIKMERTSYEVDIDIDEDIEVEVQVDIIADIEIDMEVDEVEEVEEIEAIEEVDDFYVVVEDLPSFPGGKAALAKFISSNIKYPENALTARKSGTVLVYMRINEQGKIESAKVKKSVFPSLDKEALRIVKSMPDWIPGSQHGKPVSCDLDLPIEFRLK